MTAAGMFKEPELDPDLDLEVVPAEPAAVAGGGSGNQAAGGSRFPGLVPGTTGDVVPGMVPGSGGTTVPGSGDGSGEPGSGLVPVTAASPRRVSMVESAWLSVQEWVVREWDSQRRHRSFWHWVLKGLVSPPESLAAHWKHVRGKSWLRDYMTGSFRTFCAWEGTAYGIAAQAATFALQNLIKIIQRQHRFWLALAAIACVALIWTVSH